MQILHLLNLSDKKLERKVVDNTLGAIWLTEVTQENERLLMVRGLISEIINC